jgi:hypothetical protein
MQHFQHKVLKNVASMQLMELFNRVSKVRAKHADTTTYWGAVPR